MSRRLLPSGLPPVTDALLLRYKQEATKFKKQTGLKHSQALDYIANAYCFPNWKAVVKAHEQTKEAAVSVPKPSLDFINDVCLMEDEKKMIQLERQVELGDDVKLKIIKNRKALTQLAIEYSIFEPTFTGLNKFILDATQAVRTHFELTGFHFYREQRQGEDGKITKEAYFLTPSKKIKSRMSLYRPNTKKGDPRMWFQHLPSFACPCHQIAIIIKNDSAFLINLSVIDIEEIINSPMNPIKEFIESCNDNSIANELIEKLKYLSQSPIEATHVGDTAIGMSIEHALGITANSSKLPDYKGIELKSGRGLRNRTTLFAQVANWSISPLKKSADILDKYGYQREEDFKLYCTVSTKKPNSQGLIFKYEKEKDELQEWYAIQDNDTCKYIEHVATWSGDMLRERLKEKHNETFWIEADSEFINGKERFTIISVTHTKTPLLSQLLPLIESGVVTMDHLIKRSGKNKRVSEKGPLFKIDKKNIELLFPNPVKYKLKN
ncbi:MvaI/BcnI family restriction endonuclease [Xenorhabdus sp. IM139775]|uniref:MvaI/BcnI family restriction endonuclease n=1 Tax=Xenorhabdus sp. IM139775 TaxID=3025876 RepID=UPI00235A427D|nr:MvaI/BcnI family restriction endonuclease [Xenorhabdus sp. IM139775]MDC9592160.1 MvaI/BcnI family restriction endonuclease [Xenorhabdus sp. IM139775]